jgi:hypothetical protein
MEYKTFSHEFKNHVIMGFTEILWQMKNNIFIWIHWPLISIFPNYEHVIENLIEFPKDHFNIHENYLFILFPFCYNNFKLLLWFNLG